MANVNRARGFIPAKSLIGAPMAGMLRRFEAADRTADTVNNHGDIYIGDPVKLVAGKVLPANSGDIVLGVVTAIGAAPLMFDESGAFDPNNLAKQHLLLTEAGVVYVMPAEAMLFTVQENLDLDLVEGSLADITSAAAASHGSRITSMSTVSLTTVTVNNDVKVVEHVTSPDNDKTLIYGKFLVKFQNVVNGI